MNWMHHTTGALLPLAVIHPKLRHHVCSYAHQRCVVRGELSIRQDRRVLKSCPNTVPTLQCPLVDSPARQSVTVMHLLE